MSSAVVRSDTLHRVASTLRAPAYWKARLSPINPSPKLRLIPGGLAGREHHQVGVEAHALEDFPGLKQAILTVFGELLGDGESEGGVQGEVVVEQAVSREVDDADVFAERLGAFLGRLFSQLDAHRLGAEEAGDSFDFVTGVGQRLDVVALGDISSRLVNWSICSPWSLGLRFSISFWVRS